MKIKGIVTTVLRDAKTLEIREEKTQENHIQEDYFKRLLYSNYSGKTHSVNTSIFISSDNPESQRTDWSNGQINNARSGSNISGVEPERIVLDYQPGMHLAEFVKRFGAPSSDTDINMIGLCENTSGGSADEPDAVVWISETVTQKTTDIIDIFYRVQFTFDVIEDYKNFSQPKFQMSPSESRKFANAAIGVQNHDFHYYYSNKHYSCWHSLDKQPFRFFDFFKNQYSGNTVISLSSAQRPNYDLMKNSVYGGFDVNDYLGHAISWVGASREGDLLHLIRDGADPVQSIFGHNSLSDTPFYNSVNSNLGLGKISVKGDDWTNPDVGKYIFIDVKSNGLTGTSTYKFRKQPFFGFNGNTWSPKNCYLPSSHFTNRHISSGFAISRDDYRNSPEPGYESTSRSAMSQPFLYKGGFEVLFLWKNEFAIINVLTGEAVYAPFDNERLFGSETLPEFLAEDIIQHYVSGDFVYIACAVTGLYRIHPVNDTIEKMNSSNTGLEDTSGCYGICEGFNGRLYAYFDHLTAPTIYYSDDNGVSWISSNMVYSDFVGDMKSLMGIQASKTESDGHLAIIYKSNDKVRFSWYNLSTNTVTKNVDFTEDFNRKAITNYHLGHNYGYSECITCSPNQGKWAATCSNVYYSGAGETRFYEFGGSVSYTLPADLETRQMSNRWVIDKNGNDALLLATDTDDNNSESLGVGSVVIVTDGSSYEGYGLGFNLSGNGAFYLKDGLWLGYSSYGTLEVDEDKQAEGYRFNFLTLLVGTPRYLDHASFDSTYGLMAYPEYGWDGSSWIAGHPDAKFTHASHEELFDGVTMAWDDEEGGQQFLASDHYTTAIFNGIVMDGTTSFDYESTFYAKEVEELTDVESATLPSEQKVSNIMAEFIPQGDVDFQDLDSMNTDEQSGELKGTGNGLYDDYTGRARSANVVIEGGSVSFLPNKCFLPDSDINNALGWVETDYYMNDDYHAQTYFGLSDSSVLGTVIDPSTIQYGMHFDSEPNNGGSVGTARLSVIESGIERAFVTGIEYDRNQRPEFRIILLNTGVMVYEYKQYNQSKWTRLYESPSVGMVPLVGYYFDVAAVPRSNYGLENLKYGSIDPNNSDYFVYFGNGVDSGLFDPEFRAIDANHSKIYIDGEESVVMDSDMDTVLGSNRVSIFPYDGVMRYSGDDAGKTISVSLLLVKL